MSIRKEQKKVTFVQFIAFDFCAKSRKLSAP